MNRRDHQRRGRSQRPQGTHSEAGFTLPEVAVYLAVFFVVLVPVVKLSVETTRSYTGQVRVTEQSSRIAAALARIEAELRMATASSLDCTSGSVAFRSLTGVSGHTRLVGETLRLELIPDPSDPADGFNNDGNGLADEQSLVLWEDLAPTGGTAGPEDPVWVLCDFMAPGGLTVTRDREYLTVTVEYLMSVEAGRDSNQESATLSVAVRN